MLFDPLENNSIFQRCLYSCAISVALRLKLFVRNINIFPVSASLNFISPHFDRIIYGCVIIIEHNGLIIQHSNKQLNDLLIGLSNLYSKMAKQALTDQDENNYHDNEIKNIIEAEGIQIYYQVDKDWFYRNEERRYIPMNDNSSWYKIKGNPTRFESRVFEMN
jgi:hypothetical protein